MILLVDDDPNVLEACEMVLGAHNFHVLPCKSGEEALKIFTTYQEEITILITDYNMPKMNGIELIQHLRMRQPNIKAILTSGSFNQETPANITLLQKPFPFETLIQTINEHKELSD